MNTKLILIFAALSTSALTFGQSLPLTAPVVPEADGVFQVRFFANMDSSNITTKANSDSFINITNAGTLGGTTPGGDICANVYVFAPDEQMVSCCSCAVTPDGLVSLSAINDLITNSLTPAVERSIVVKLLATAKGSGTCNAASPTATNLARGMRAWGTTLHPAAVIGNFRVADTEFSKAELSPTELGHITQFCGFIQANGSGYGICNSCRLGGLGAAKEQ